MLSKLACYIITYFFGILSFYKFIEGKIGIGFLCFFIFVGIRYLVFHNDKKPSQILSHDNSNDLTIDEVYQTPSSDDHVTDDYTNIDLNKSISEYDDYFVQAGKYIIEKDKASIGMLQRVYKVGFNRAYTIMEHLYDAGVVGLEEGTRPRKVLMSMGEFEYFISNAKKTSPDNQSEPYPYSCNFQSNDFDNMDGHAFEYYCADLLQKNGFTNVTVTKESCDQGIDILAEKDSVSYGIQCKCYSSDIGNRAVQEAFAGKFFYDCHVAIVLTNRYFTLSAKELAQKNGIVLWDRDKLIELVNQHKLENKNEMMLKFTELEEEFYRLKNRINEIT